MQIMERDGYAKAKSHLAVLVDDYWKLEIEAEAHQRWQTIGPNLRDYCEYGERFK